MVTLRSSSTLFCCTGAGAVIEKVTDAVALSELQAAVTVTVAELVAVGVPEMAPVEELILKPAGKVAE